MKIQSVNNRGNYNLIQAIADESPVFIMKPVSGYGVAIMVTKSVEEYLDFLAKLPKEQLISTNVADCYVFERGFNATFSVTYRV